MKQFKKDIALGRVKSFDSTDALFEDLDSLPTVYLPIKRRQRDGHWRCLIEAMPGVAASGQTEEEALHNVKALALQLLAEDVRTGKRRITSVSFSEDPNARPTRKRRRRVRK